METANAGGHLFFFCKRIGNDRRERQRQIHAFHWRKAEGMEAGGGYEAGYRRHADGHVKNYAERD